MGTVVCLHAHPDDESITTGGTIARARHDGHRVVLVVATDGAHGEVPDDLGPDETLADRRRCETERSAAVLGVDRVEFLGYSDSGMTGWDQNDDAGSFCRADVDTAARMVSEILLDESADILTIYDWHGGYGHPDHVQVHRVGCRAEQLVSARLPGLRVLEATMNRDHLRRAIGELVGPDDEPFDPDGPMDDGNPMGTPESELTLAVDVSGFVGLKRASIAAHRSQISDSGFFAAMPDDVFAGVFGTEWFIEHDREPGPRSGWLFE